MTTQNIPHIQVERNNPSIEPETQRGYVVFRMKEADVPHNALQLMHKQCGQILEANSVDGISPYHQKLEAIPILSNPTPKPNLVKLQIPTNALEQINQAPSQELVDLLEDVCLKEDLTSSSDRIFDSLSNADLKWIETTINKEFQNPKHHIAVPSIREGQDWELFKEYCLAEKFESLLEATQEIPGQHSYRLASLKVFQDQGDELFETDRDLSFQMEDEFQEKIQEFVNCNDYISSKTDKILQTQIVPLLGKRTIFQSGASPLPPSQIRLFERISHFQQADRDTIAPEENSISPTESIHEKSFTPSQIQLERTKAVAPIVKDYLDLANTHHHSGSVHTATWDKNSQILSLVDNRSLSLKLLAKWENHQWTALPIPLTDSKSPNLTEADVTHFQSLVPKIEASWEKKRAQYRSWYTSSAFEILSSVKGSQPTPEQLDLAIALSILSESDDRNDVSKVLSQSDTVLAMKTTLPPTEYQTQMTEYIERIYRQAFEKVQSIEVNNEDLER
ncbi:MAG: hypothetical protein HC820_07545 [Hydrococcus sp. RM1_1_31]|nr:hypothetical protein [Hydrococcus sp. RM1_1_31]